jgi:hypothetical protein
LLLAKTEMVEQSWERKEEGEVTFFNDKKQETSSQVSTKQKHPQYSYIQQRVKKSQRDMC